MAGLVVIPFHISIWSVQRLSVFSIQGALMRKWYQTISNKLMKTSIHFLSMKSSDVASLYKFKFVI